MGEAGVAQTQANYGNIQRICQDHGERLTKIEALMGQTDKKVEALVESSTQLNRQLATQHADFRAMMVEFKLVKTIAFGAVGFIVMAVFSALIGMVIFKAPILAAASAASVASTALHR